MGIVPGRLGTRVQVASACVLVAVVQLAGVAAPASAQIDAERARAEELESKIAERGRALSLADEEFNKARIERQRIETQAAAARSLVASAEERWGQLRDRLSQRVRLLYMHPGAAIDAWLGVSSLSDLARAQKLGSSVLMADTELVTETERARQEVLARARRLEGVQGAAQAKERELASRRSEVTAAIGEQRELLGEVKGDIAALMEEQRQREIEAAQNEAEEAPSGDDGASPPVIGDDPGAGGPSNTPPPAAGPAPSVKSGASKAVATAAAQIGKPYEWAAEGPDSYDCSGLTMYAWASAGVSLPHSSQAQYASLPHVARSQIQPGDLLFYGSPIHHVGIYEGGGVMINAPETGEFVRRNSIARSDYVGAARP